MLRDCRRRVTKACARRMSFGHLIDQSNVFIHSGQKEARSVQWQKDSRLRNSACFMPSTESSGAHGFCAGASGSIHDDDDDPVQTK
ncbi:hypothetical protein Mapa_004208 [Marchantia paleacea]|nr:hypothetical protein Mapa_004208 [Marchantia paleacea]